AVNSVDRLGAPLVRRRLLDASGEGDELVEASWGKALEVASRGLAQARSVHGAGAVALLGGARLPNEDAYAWAKFAKGVLGTDNVDCQLDDGLPAEAVLGLPRATVDDACSADAVVLLGPDVKEELPVLYLRLKAAAVDDGMPIVELAPQRSGMSAYCKSTLLYRPGEAAVLAEALAAGEDPRDEVAGVPADEIAAARRILGAPLEGQIVVVLGRPSVAERGESITAAAAALAARYPGVRFLPALRRANVMGALDMGLAPGVLPGRVGLDEGRAWFGERWPGLPERRGLDARGIMAAAARGQMQGLLLLGADPVTDYPDRQLARQALAGAGFVVAVDTFLTASSVHADVVLPAAAYAERSGTTTNIEGRITRLGQKIVPPGVAWPDWVIAVELAARLGADLGVESLDAIWGEIERVAPSHAGVTGALLADRRFRDGVIPPVSGGRPSDLGPAGESRTDATAGATTSVPGAIDPMSTPGIGAVESQGVPATEVVGNGRSPGGAVEDTAGEGPQAGDGAPRRPAVLRFTAPGDAPVPPSRDAYSLRLVAARKLYGHGTLVQESPSLAPLAAAPVLRVHPSELERLGMSEGGRVRVRGGRATFLVDACPDAGVPWGSVSLAFNAAGQPAGRDGSAPGQRLPAAGELIDSGTTVTDVRIETP
ncbi:MAG TPA: molybdopterin-dependent oxidoreductase, partial [Acidimicrobiales bacterium]|nr:molybdopterin-dependent oxidoreductase [Acidimicrobiales bacterium]